MSLESSLLSLQWKASLCIPGQMKSISRGCSLSTCTQEHISSFNFSKCGLVASWENFVYSYFSACRLAILWPYCQVARVMVTMECFSHLLLDVFLLWLKDKTIVCWLKCPACFVSVNDIFILHLNQAEIGRSYLILNWRIVLFDTFSYTFGISLLKDTSMLFHYVYNYRRLLDGLFRSHTASL